MTVVAACRFNDSAILLCDSRVTWRPGGRQDELQKILSLGPRLVFAFAGNVRATAAIAAALRERVAKEKRFSNTQLLRMHLPRIARFHHKKSTIGLKPEPLELLLAEAPDHDRPRFWHYSSLNQFNGREVGEEYIVLGSGKAIANYFMREHPRLSAANIGLKAKADAVIFGISAQLNFLQEQSVGGLLQVVTLDTTGIRPFHYGFMTLDPDRPPSAKEIEFERGGWIQQNLTTGVPVRLADPSMLRSPPVLRREFHNYEPPPTLPVRGHLYNFLLCRSVSADAFSTSVLQASSTWVSNRYPFPWNQVILLGLWSTRRKIAFTVRLLGPTEKIDLGQFEHTFTFRPIPEQILIQVSAEIPAPGLYFLEIHIGDTKIGRKPMFFGNLRSEVSVDPDQAEVRAIQDALAECSSLLVNAPDNELPVHLDCGLDYFYVCQQLHADPPLLRVIGAMASVHWGSYPLPLSYSLGLQTRLPAGSRHELIFETVNAATGHCRPFGKIECWSNSDTAPIQIYHQGVLQIDEPGWNYVNVRADGKRLASLLLVAETAKAKWSFSLLPEDVVAVQEGELLIIAQNSIVQPTMITRIVDS